MSNFEPNLPLEELRENFSDIAPPLTPDAARLEASRCLFCFDAPCIRSCPTEINIPQFIQQISNGDVIGSAKTIFTQNIVGGSCGRVCPTEVLCEGACVYNQLNQKPIEIGRLQRFATDHAISSNHRFFTKGSPTGRLVAIIGAGPAGLSCAHELTKLGHECTVFEGGPVSGGLDTYGVAGYKISTDFALREAEYIKQIGFHIQLNTPIGSKPSLSQLLKDFDAVFVGVGLGNTARLHIEGEDLEGCLEAMDFIRPTRDLEYKGCRIGQEVLVIGGGNTAIDVATAAVRLGSPSVTIVYRRDRAHMPAFQYEFNLAKADGVHFRWLTAPVRVIGKKGKVTALECVRMRQYPSKGKDVARLEKIDGSEHQIPCDMVIKALGQLPLDTLFQEHKQLLTEKGLVKVAPDTCATAIPGLYAGGDCINGGGEVVDATQHGKLAAAGINRYLYSLKTSGRKGV